VSALCIDTDISRADLNRFQMNDLSCARQSGSFTGPLRHRHQIHLPRLGARDRVVISIRRIRIPWRLPMRQEVTRIYAFIKSLGSPNPLMKALMLDSWRIGRRTGSGFADRYNHTIASPEARKI